MNYSQLFALRNAQRDSINIDPRIVTGTRPALKDNGAGVLVPDPDTAPADLGSARVRIASERESVPRSKETPVGLATNLAEMLIQDYCGPFQEGDIITDGTTSWEIGHINPKKYQGRIYGSTAALKTLEPVAIAIPTGIEAEVLSDTEIDLTWDNDNLANGYQVERKTGTGAYAIVGTIAAGIYIFHDTGLIPETTYSYRMRESLDGKYSSYSETVEATTEAE